MFPHFTLMQTAQTLIPTGTQQNRKSTLISMLEFEWDNDPQQNRGILIETDKQPCSMQPSQTLTHDSF